jgi:hypothetical protein
MAAWAWTMIGSALLVDAQALPRTPGDSMQSLTPIELAAFREGLNTFSEEATVRDGLGPAFNGTSCAVCHDLPAIG